MSSSVCPKCGDPSPQLREAVAAQLERIQQAGSEPAPAASGESSNIPGGGGTHVGGEQLMVGLVTQLLLDLGGAALDAAVVRPASEWWKSTGQAKARERRVRMMHALNEGLDRHSELYLCVRDKLVFFPGGAQTVPVNEAVRLLFKHDDAGLMSRLSS